MVKVTYYLDVISSWCYWAEPAWLGLKSRWAGAVTFDWKIALMDDSGLPVSEAQEAWFYRRSGTLMRSGRMLNTGWFEAGLREYLAPNAVAVAARQLGIQGDAARLVLAEAAMRDGVRVGRWEESVRVIAQTFGLDPKALEQKARSASVSSEIQQSTTEFKEFKMTVRPAFLIENTIGDRAVLSGMAVSRPLDACIETLLADAQGYAAYAAHHGPPPAS